jgi:hypothetical protein
VSALETSVAQALYDIQVNPQAKDLGEVGVVSSIRSLLLTLLSLSGAEALVYPERHASGRPRWQGCDRGVYSLHAARSVPRRSGALGPRAGEEVWKDCCLHCPEAHSPGSLCLSTRLLSFAQHLCFFVQDPGHNNNKKLQKRPHSRTVTAVHDAILEDLVYPVDIIGK